jgi:Mrp family chromosome partitioning ATPase
VLALGRLLATRGLRVVLVDADFRHPHLARQLGLSVEQGLESVLAGEVPLADALVESLDDRLTLLPLKGLVADPRLLVGNRALVESLDALRAAFDLVIVDAGPVADDAAAVDLAASLGPAAIDDALVVRDVRRIHGGMSPAIARRLAAVGLTRWEAVETFVPLELRP